MQLLQVYLHFRKFGLLLVHVSCSWSELEVSARNLMVLLPCEIKKQAVLLLGLRLFRHGAIYTLALHGHSLLSHEVLGVKA